MTAVGAQPSAHVDPLPAKSGLQPKAACRQLGCRPACQSAAHTARSEQCWLPTSAPLGIDCSSPACDPKKLEVGPPYLLAETSLQFGVDP
jgi:hypothetical protein